MYIYIYIYLVFKSKVTLRKKRFIEPIKFLIKSCYFTIGNMVFKTDI